MFRGGGSDLIEHVWNFERLDESNGRLNLRTLDSTT